MSQGFAKHFGGEDVEIYSGGTEPAEEIDENAVKVMEEIGIDISGQKPSEIDPDKAVNSDAVVTMGCGANACPAPIGGENFEWDIEDPSGKSIDMYREVRGELRKRVKALVKDLSEEGT